MAGRIDILNRNNSRSKDTEVEISMYGNHEKTSLTSVKTVLWINRDLAIYNNPRSSQTEV